MAKEHQNEYWKISPHVRTTAHAVCNSVLCRAWRGDTNQLQGWVKATSSLTNASTDDWQPCHSEGLPHRMPQQTLPGTALQRHKCMWYIYLYL